MRDTDRASSRREAVQGEQARAVERERGRRAEAAARMLRCRRRAGEDGPQEEEAVEQLAELAEAEVEVEAVVHRRQRRRTVSQGMVAVSVLSSGEVGRWSAAVGGLARAW